MNRFADLTGRLLTVLLFSVVLSLVVSSCVGLVRVGEKVERGFVHDAQENARERLAALLRQYEQSGPEGKAAIRPQAVQLADGVDLATLPDEVGRWVKMLRDEMEYIRIRESRQH